MTLLSDRGTFNEDIRIISPEVLMDAVKYDNILDYLFDAVYYVDVDKKIIYWNKAAERVT